MDYDGYSDGETNYTNWRIGEQKRQTAQSVSLRSANYIDPVQAIANRWLEEKAAAVQQRQSDIPSCSPSPVGLRHKCPFRLTIDDLLNEEPPSTIDPQLIRSSSASPLPRTSSPAFAGPSSEPPRTSLPSPAQSSAPAIPPAVEAYLASNIQVLPPLELERVIKGWDVLQKYQKGDLETGPASKELEMLNRNDSYDVEWAELFKRIMETETDDVKEAESIQNVIIARRPASEVAIALPAPDERPIRGWGILYEFWHNTIDLDKAFEGLKSLHRDDALDAEWAEMWQRIQAIHPEDECEFQAIQAILVAHDPTTNSASTSSTEYEAWQIVAHCLLKWRNQDVARRELEDMSAGRKWFAMLDRIQAAQENVHSEAFTQIRIDLAKMKPGTFHDDDKDDEDNESNNEGHALHDDNEALDILDIVDSYVDDELDQEQKDLLNYFNLTLRQTEIWDKYGVYHVRCFVSC